MYTEFYNLTDKPFNLTPSPRYLYLGEVHKEALASLTYGVVERKGFIVLTGEVGSGKTTMVQALLAHLDENVETVYVSNPMLSNKDFMDYLACSAFKRKVRFKSKADFLMEFEKFLKDCLRNQRIFLLIVDEAQRLSFSLLEEIRLLSNMETADEKLINIFLVGQPELNEKLTEPRCRALLQRVSVRHHIRPLDLNETKEYLMTRLKIAGAPHGEKIFPKPTIKVIHQYSEGYPRMINILADNTLLLGYSRGKKKISPEMIKECYEDVRPKTEKEPTRGKGRPVRNVMVQEKSKKSARAWKWAIVVLAVAATATVTATYRKDIGEKIEKILASQPRVLAFFTKGKEKSPKIQIPAKLPHPTSTVSESETSTPSDQSGEYSKSPQGEVVQPSAANMVESSKERPSEIGGPQMEVAPERENLTNWPVRVVKPGDTLAELATEVYGYVDQKVLKLVQKHNPEISNINLINVGQKIVFPPVSAKEVAPTYTVYIASYVPFGAARQEFQRLTAQGYEAYIIPAKDPDKGKIYRITIGNFDNLEYVQEYADLLIEKGITPYAKPIELEMK